MGGYTQKSVGLDPGFGSSNFDVCITELRDGLVNVIHAEEYQRPVFGVIYGLIAIVVIHQFLGSSYILYEGLSNKRS